MQRFLTLLIPLFLALQHPHTYKDPLCSARAHGKPSELSIIKACKHVQLCTHVLLLCLLGEGEVLLERGALFWLGAVEMSVKLGNCSDSLPDSLPSPQQTPPLQGDQSGLFIQTQKSVTKKEWLWGMVLAQGSVPSSLVLAPKETEKKRASPCPEVYQNLTEGEAAAWTQIHLED